MNDTDTANTPEAEAAFVDILVTVFGGPLVDLADVATEEIDPEEELAQAIAAARADDCWDEDTEDAWTADDEVALDLEDQLEQALAIADADSNGRDFLDTEAYQLADTDTDDAPAPEWLQLLQDADQINSVPLRGLDYGAYRKYQHAYWVAMKNAREAIEPEMRKVRAHFAKIAPDGCGDLEQDPSDASFVHVFGALAPQARRLAGCTTKVYAELAAAWTD